MAGIDDIRSVLKQHRDTETKRNMDFLSATKSAVDNIILESVTRATDWYNVRRFMIGFLLKGEYNNEENDILRRVIAESLSELEANYSLIGAEYNSHGIRDQNIPTHDWGDPTYNGISVNCKEKFNEIPYLIYNADQELTSAGQFRTGVEDGQFIIFSGYIPKEENFFAGHADRGELCVVVVEFP
tara:strand:+ start:179 stop:733 length:555 start_codon:yes stop_codon:yes gene_type:complete